MSSHDGVTRLLRQAAQELAKLDPETVRADVALLGALADVGEAHDFLWYRLTTADEHAGQGLAELVARIEQADAAGRLNEARRALDRAKRWRRRAYRATLAVGGLVSVVLVGLSLLAGSGTSDHRFQVPTGASGVAVGGLTWVMGTTDFRHQWQVFTDAQAEMEYDLAEWELATPVT